MIKTEKEGLKQLLNISLPYILISAFYSIGILLLEEKIGDHIYKVSGQIGSVFGLAVAFFLGFRMNSAYDRWWEARKIFGELTNTTRSFVAKVSVYCQHSRHLNNQPAVAVSDDLIDLTIAFIRQLKCEMHDQKTIDLDEKTKQLFLEHNIDFENKVSNELLIAITNTIELNFSQNSPIEKSDLMQHVNRFYDVQGKAERIKNTPFLLIYSVFTRITVFFYVLLLPLFIGDIDLGGENSKLELLAIPIMIVISSVFLTIDKLANLFAEPFSERKTSVPIDAICNSIVKNVMEVKMKKGKM
jgi:putative membrane protein